MASTPVTLGGAAATAPATTQTPAAGATTKQPDGFVRFIDAIGNFFRKPAVKLIAQDAEEVAVAAEPILALTPFGPEYNLVTNAIVGAQQNAAESLQAAGTTLSGTQKFALVSGAVYPALTAILASKGIKETAAQDSAISEYIQNVYNLQSGPVVIPQLPGK